MCCMFHQRMQTPRAADVIIFDRVTYGAFTNTQTAHSRDHRAVILPYTQNAHPE